MSQKTILYANTIDYNFALQQRPHHIMNIFAKRGYKVYWVNASKDESKGIEIINENLEVYNSWDVFKQRVKSVDIHFVSWSSRYVDLCQIESKMVIYDSLDNFEENERNELNMIEKADILLTTSEPLYDIRKDQHKNIHMCRNACFSELGELKYDIPKDLVELKKTGKPIVLFSGALSNSWCDIELFERISYVYKLVMVGKFWGLDNSFKNLTYLGEKSYSELQAYYNHCDVNILPFKRCQIADYSNPIKNYEAMSHGKVTVSTNIPEAMIYPNIVLTSNNHDDFIRNIKKGIRMGRDEKVVRLCKDTAKDNDWNKRVDVIEDAINEMGVL